MKSGGLKRTKLAVVLLSLLGLLAQAGYAQQATPPAKKPARATPPATKAGAPATAKPTPPPPGEKVVLRIGQDQVTDADFIFVVEGLAPDLKQTIAAQGRRPVGEQYALMLLLSQRAVERQVESSPDFNRRMKLQRIQWLAEAEATYMEGQVQVSPEEINQFYLGNSQQFEEVQVRDLVVRKKPAGGPQDAPGLSSEQARSLAASLRQAVAGGKDMKQAAQENAGSGNVFVGTDPRAFRRGQLPAQMEQAVISILNGELTQPVETEDAVVVFQRVGSRTLELKDVSGEIRSIIRRQRMQTSLADLRQKANVWMDEEFFSATPRGAGTPGATPPPGAPPVQR